MTRRSIRVEVPTVAVVVAVAVVPARQVDAIQAEAAVAAAGVREVVRVDLPVVALAGARNAQVNAVVLAKNATCLAFEYWLEDVPGSQRVMARAAALATECFHDWDLLTGVLDL